MEHKYTYKIEKQKDAEVEIAIQVSSETFVKEKAALYERLAPQVSITGFRPGKAPKPLIEARLGARLYEEVIDHLIPHVTIEILTKENLVPLTKVNYDLVKVSDEEGLHYKAKFTVAPVIKLGDFKKVKITKNKVDVNEEEIDKAIDQLFEMQKKQENKDAKSEKAKTLTDEDVKNLRIGFNNIKELRDDFRRRLTKEKQYNEDSRQLQELIEQAIKLSEIKVPAGLVEQEIKDRESEYKARLEKLGLKVEDFLATQNTSLDELRKQWKQDAELKLGSELLFMQVIKDADLKVTPEEIQKEVDSISDEKAKAQYNTTDGRRYITSVLLQQRAIEWLKTEAGLNKVN